MSVCGCKVTDMLLKKAEQLNSYECGWDFSAKTFSHSEISALFVALPRGMEQK